MGGGRNATDKYPTKKEYLINNTVHSANANAFVVRG